MIYYKAFLEDSFTDQDYDSLNFLEDLHEIYYHLYE